MPAILPISVLLGITPKKLSKKEITVLESELLGKLFNEIKDYLRERYKNFFHLMKFNKQMEMKMLENNFVQLIIKDILASGDYTLEGIAHYMNMNEDVLIDVSVGINQNPSALILRKSIELHKTVRPQLYLEISKKIIADYLANKKLALVSDS